MRKYLGKATLVVCLLLVTTQAGRADKVLELKAANYDPIAGVWMDSSGNGNDAIGLVSPPSQSPGQTLNGSAVVTFDGTNYLTLTTGISSTAFTCFAYVRPNPVGINTIVAGNTGSFQYRIRGNFQGQQEVLVRNLVNLGHSDTIVDTTVFSTISVAIGAAPATFRLNEVNDGSANRQFTAPTDLVGAAGGNPPNENYSGDIAEIRIYNSVLSDEDRAAIEEEIRKTYEM